MTKRNINRQISLLLSAGMVCTMLAPAMPVHAAGYQTIKFDTGIYKKYEGKTLPDLVSGGTQKVVTRYPNLKKDTGANGQAASSVDSDNNAEMPWWDEEWDSFNNGSTTLKPSASAGDFGAPINDVPFDFSGYSFAGWYEGDYSANPTLQRVNKLPRYFPPAGEKTEKVYYARYVSDGTEFKKNVIHHDKTPLGVFGSGLSSKAFPERLKVLATAQARPLVIPGLKASISMVGTQPNIKVYKPNTTTEVAALNGVTRDFAYYGFTIDTDTNNVTGAMANVDLEVNYDYNIDPDTAFSFTSEHVYFAKDNHGNYVEESRRLERVALHAGDAINDASAAVVRKPDQNAIDGIRDAQGDPKYKLVTVNDQNPNNSTPLPGVKAPEFVSGTAAEPARYVVGHDPVFAANYTVDGFMPNQSMGTRYYYVLNDDYDIGLTVNYVDENEDSIAQLVKDASGANFTIQANGAVDFAVTPNSVNSIPGPDLTAQGYEAIPNYTVTSGSFEIGLIERPTATRPTFIVNMGGSSATIQVKYARNADSWAKALISEETTGGGNGGKLWLDALHTVQYDNSSGTPIRVKKNASGTDVTINYGLLPEAVPAPGYVFDGYYITSTNALIPSTGNSEVPVSGPVSDSTFNITARFSRDASWKNFKFSFGQGNGYMNPTSSEVQLYPFDATGTSHRVVTLDDMLDTDPNAEFSAVMPRVVVNNPATDIVKWFDVHGNEITGSTDIASRASGEEFFAYIVPSAGFVADTPIVEGAINESTGAVSIRVLPDLATGRQYNPDPNAQYAVTDEAGNIVSLISNLELQAAGGVITNGIHLGRNYRVYEVAPAHGLTVGENIAAAPLASATPGTATTPVAVEPTLAVDTVDDRYNQMTIDPVTPNTQYALLDAAGNVVEDWTTPSGNSITFQNLVPDGIYHVVARPISDTSTPATDPSLGRLQVVATVGTGRNTLSFNGIAASELTITPNNLDLTNIPRNTSVEISAPSVDSQGSTFKRWNVVSGNVTLSGTGRNIVFTMPNGNVVLEALYDDGINHSDWAAPYQDNSTGDSKNIGVQTPLVPKITTPIDQELRVNIQKRAVPGATRIEIAAMEQPNGRYTALWEVTAKIEQRTMPAGPWADYSGPITQGIHLTVETGALRNDREYVLYEIASGSNATPTAISGVIDPNWGLPNSGYPGNFTMDAVNGARYIFGYTMPDTYRVIIRDSRDNTRVTLFDVSGVQTVDHFASLYSSSIVQGPVVDLDGITWEYRGLSDSRDTFHEYDTNLPITSDLNLYLFYQGDRDERRDANNELTGLIQRANDLLNTNISMGSKSMLQAAILAAREVQNRTAPTKATTSQLEAAIAALQRVINSLTGGGGGGSTGGSGGGGSASTKTGTAVKKSLTVGVDGDWQLLDEQNHIWVFVLNNGSRVNGWNRLTYTYEGKTRTDWYYFNSDGIMRDGWFYDVENANWYYFSEDHDGFFGSMTLGWYKDHRDHKWYYLDANTGIMKTGWNNLGGEWYFLNPTAPAPTYYYSDVEKKWLYNTNATTRPLGSMYENETTPDGFNVNASGLWVR